MICFHVVFILILEVVLLYLSPLCILWSKETINPSIHSILSANYMRDTMNQNIKNFHELDECLSRHKAVIIKLQGFDKELQNLSIAR